ncbi:MAG: DUF2163 domain-containing protein [Alphaproteobacteria bacterium]|nr:DUF2163 domain-containing protein [Alphaproteobacteria bacterium]
MKTLPPGLSAHLQSGLTTLCYCWRLTLASGEKLGFTDHDRALQFDGTSFEAQAGFTASEIESALGLSVDNLEATGALSSTQLSDTRLKAGDFDNAQIEIWSVNWQDVSQRVLERKGHLGEVTYGQGAFKAEVRGLAHLLNQVKGRLYHYGCDAGFADARCGVAAASFTVPATVTAVAEASLSVSGLAGFADDWFTRGQVIFQSVANIGRTLAVKRHRSGISSARFDLWAAPKFTITPGESLNVIAGCDKQLSTCRDRFGNAVNFRGFPHMPGNDFVMAVASQSDPNNNGLKR